MEDLYKLYDQVMGVTLDPQDQYTVRLYDGWDNHWIDIKSNISADEALKIWADSTNHGTKMFSYDCGDYYRIFPADTRMIF